MIVVPVPMYEILHACSCHSRVIRSLPCFYPRKISTSRLTPLLLIGSCPCCPVTSPTLLLQVFIIPHIIHTTTHHPNIIASTNRLPSARPQLTLSSNRLFSTQSSCAMPPKASAPVIHAAPSPSPPPQSGSGGNDAQDLLIIQDFMDTLDQIPSELTKVHSDLNELGAVLYCEWARVLGTLVSTRCPMHDARRSSAMGRRWGRGTEQGSTIKGGSAERDGGEHK